MFIWWIPKHGQTAQALSKALEKYHRMQGWQKELRRREYWYSDAQSPTPEELFKADQDLACKVLKECHVKLPELVDALLRFVPEERKEEILCWVWGCSWHFAYTLRMCPTLDSVTQAVGDVGQQGLGSTAQDSDADTAAEEVSGGTEAHTEERDDGRALADQDSVQGLSVLVEVLV